MNKFYIFTGALIVAMVLFIKPMYYYYTETQVQTHILKTERECKKDECRYVIYTDDEVFENKDNYYFFKFASSDMQNVMMKKEETKETVVLTVTGIRLPFLSWYRNIVSVE